MVLAKRFQSRGFETSYAENGKIALDRIRGGHRPDLIVLDIMMPEMDGPELAEILRDDPRTEDIPIIFLSAVLSKRDQDRGGPNVVFPKPFDADALLSRAESLLRMTHTGA